MFISFMILGRKHDKKQETDVKIVDIFKLVIKHKSISLAYFGQGGEFQIYGVVWPLFIFFAFGSILDLGIIISLSALIASVSAIFIGKLVDKKGEKWAIKLGSPIMAISWIVRFVVTIPFMILADSLRNFSQKLVGVPLMELSYKKALESSTGAAMLFREIGLTFGAIVVLLISIILINMNLSLSTAFFIGIAFSLLPLVAVIRRRI